MPGDIVFDADLGYGPIIDKAVEDILNPTIDWIGDQYHRTKESYYEGRAEQAVALLERDIIADERQLIADERLIANMPIRKRNAASLVPYGTQGYNTSAAMAASPAYGSRGGSGTWHHYAKRPGGIWVPRDASMRGGEHHFLDVDLTAKACSTTGSVSLLNTIANGTSTQQELG